MGKWIIALLFGGVASAFMMAGAWMAWKQHTSIEHSVPTWATITSSEVVTYSSHSKGRRRTRHSAKIAYEFSVAGTRYSAKDIHPSAMTVAADSAQALVARFPRGKTVEVFYDRRDPNNAFLIKRHDFGPYLFILFPMLHLSIGLMVALSGGSSKKQPPIEKGNGQWLLPTGMTTASKFNQAATLAAVWWIVGGLALLHFFYVAETPYDRFAVWAAAIYLAVGIGPIWVAWHFWSLMNRVSDALVTTDSYPIRRGYPLRVNVKLEMAGGGNIETATATLVCRRTTRSNTSGKNQTVTTDAWADEQSFARAQDLVADRAISGDVTFVVPREQYPSSLKGDRSYPRHKWELRVHVKRAGPDYKTKFPVDVV